MKSLHLLLCVVLVILILSSLCILNRRHQNQPERYTPDIHILSTEELIQTITNNHTFWNSLTPDDWKLRKVSDLPEYIQLIRPLVVDRIDLHPTQVKQLQDLCRDADARLRNVDVPYFDTFKAMAIPWRIGFVREEKYEWGWPHTMEDVIILPEAYLQDNPNSDQYNRLVRTLVHEKVHVYQRKYPEDMENYLRYNGFERWRRREPGEKIVRPNPDLDGWVYKQNGQAFTTEMIKKISTPDPDPQFYEHPFENMAIRIARLAQ